MLDLARIRRGTLELKPEIIDAHELVNQVIGICADDVDRAEIDLSLELGAACHHVDADSIRFQQALWNLIKNAIKFTPGGGRVTVRTGNRPIGADSSNGQALVVEISDTGIGIEPDAIGRILDLGDGGGPAAGRRFGGLGLGLTLSRSIIEKHGGKLTAASAGPGEGATFTVEIPAVPQPAMIAGEPLATAFSSSAETPPARRELRILLVDDNEDTLLFLSTMLRRRGHHVVTAGDMAQALGLFDAEERDLLISDIELPDGSGLELMDTIRSRKPMPGIALSGFGMPTTSSTVSRPGSSYTSPSPSISAGSRR